MASPMRWCSRSRACCVVAAVLALAALASACRLGAPAAEGSETDWHAVSVSSLLPSAVCMATKAAPNSSALNVVHRHGPCSPLQSRGGPPSHAEILGWDQDRVASIHRRIAGATASKGTSRPAHWGASLNVHTYFVSIGLGTPAKHFSVEFDTGSDLSWVQCKPCTECYKQQDPLFDPTKSSTYTAVSCGAQECQESGSRSCSSDNKCRYEVLYADKSKTDGNLVRDTLTLTPTNTVPGFIFGCGHKDAGTFGKLDGLIGLGRGNVSLSSQAATKYGAGFSYCLPSSSSAAGYLSFGRSAPANTQFTAMVTGHDVFYYLNLTGIKVAGRAVKIPPAVFATAGTIIDSGTTFTWLPSRAHAAIRSAFRRLMGKYKRAPSLRPQDTCYDFTGHRNVHIPSVALVFAGGATVTLDPSGVFAWYDVSQVCLTFVSNGDDTSLGVLGCLQQKTLAIVYDVANQKIGFGAKGCA